MRRIKEYASFFLSLCLCSIFFFLSFSRKCQKHSFSYNFSAVYIGVVWFFYSEHSLFAFCFIVMRAVLIPLTRSTACRKFPSTCFAKYLPHPPLCNRLHRSPASTIVFDYLPMLFHAKPSAILVFNVEQYS